MPLSRVTIGGVIMTDQKQELMRMLNGKKLKGYHISL